MPVTVEVVMVEVVGSEMSEIIVLFGFLEKTKRDFFLIFNVFVLAFIDNCFSECQGYFS